MIPSAAELAVHISGKDLSAARTFKEVHKEAMGLGKVLGDVSKIAGGFVIGTGIMKLGGFLVDATKAAADDAASQARLKQAVENTGASYNDLSGVLAKTISASQKLGFTDDQTRDSLSILTAQTGDAREAMERYRLAQDLSRGANIDVVTASRLLGKVTDENVNVLARYGIKVEKGAEATELFGAIQAKFGGQSAAFADTTAGKMAILSDRMGELKETIGGALLPILTTVTEFTATKLVPVIEGLAAQGLPMLREAFTQVSAAIQPLIDKVRPFVEEMSRNKEVMAAAAAVVGGVLVVAFGALAISAGAAAISIIAATAPIIAIGAAIGLLTLGIVMLVKHWDEIRVAVPELGQAFDAVREIVETVRETISDHMTEIRAVFTFLQEHVKARIEGVIGILTGLVQMVKSVADLVRAVIHGRWAEAWTALKTIAKTAVDLLMSSLKAQFGNLPELLWNAGYDAIMGLVDGMKNRANKVLETARDIANIVPDTMRKIWQAFSPSRVMFREGENLMTGLQGGMASKFDEKVKPWLTAMTKQVNDTVGAWKQPSSGGGGGGGGSFTGSGGSGGNTPAPTAPIPGVMAAGLVHPRLRNNPNIRRRYAQGTDYVPETGLAMLHRGEAVIPAGQNRGGLVINVTVLGSIHSGDDIAEIIRDKILGGGFRGLPGLA